MGLIRLVQHLQLDEPFAEEGANEVTLQPVTVEEFVLLSLIELLAPVDNSQIQD